MSSTDDGLEPLIITHSAKPLKIVVFDLDETLGYFSEFGLFWNALETFFERKLTQRDFNETLDLYPEFIRPDILTILTFLKKKKELCVCNHLMIYTNNQGPKEWAVFIKNYFETKMNAVIFDRIIAAFKINGERIEFERTTHSKTHQDFIKCTKVPKNSQICFLDDVYHPDMKNDNVYYINVKPYIHNLSSATLVNRYIAKNNTPDTFAKKVSAYLLQGELHTTPKNPDEYEIDKIITKQILHHIQLFFSQTKKTQRRRTQKKQTNTRKNK